jgi:putative intracellular protease/amidase
MSSSHRRHHTALVAVADGSEDIETVTTVDVLRRAGITVRKLACDVIALV